MLHDPGLDMDVSVAVKVACARRDRVCKGIARRLKPAHVPSACGAHRSDGVQRLERERIPKRLRLTTIAKIVRGCEMCQHAVQHCAPDIREGRAPLLYHTMGETMRPRMRFEWPARAWPSICSYELSEFNNDFVPGGGNLRRASSSHGPNTTNSAGIYKTR